MFFTSDAALARRLAQGRQSGFDATTAGEARAWQTRARRRFSRLLGLHRFERAPAAPIQVGQTRCDGLLREEWRLQTEPDVWMPFYLLLPDNRDSQAPLVLCPHGHGSGGKWATAGRSDLPGMAATIAQHRYDYGVQIARAGFITACPDARGFGERREPAKQRPESLLNSSCHELTLAGGPLGLTVQGMWTWDLMRLLDHLVRDPRIDRRRIGCAGLSGGGMQALDLAALDLRVTAAIDSGYFYGVRESLQVANSNCLCNHVPGLWEHFDMGDLGALVAGRNLCIETGDADPLNGSSGLANVASQVAIARRAFDLLGGDLFPVVFSGEHRWDGERSLPWLKAHLG